MYESSLRRKRSEKKTQPWHRIKPAGWVLIGVVSLLLLAAFGWVVHVAATARGLQALPPAVEATKVKVEGEATAANHAEWVSQLEKKTDPVTGREYYQAPSLVVRQVEADYLAVRRWEAQALRSPRDALAALARYYVEQGLEDARREVKAAIRDGQVRQVRDAQRRLQVKDFSDDGLTCTLAEELWSGTVQTIDLESQEALAEEAPGHRLVFFRMRYDPDEQRWKIAGVLETLYLQPAN